MATEQHQLGVHTYRIQVVCVGAYRCWHLTVRAYHMQISCLYYQHTHLKQLRQMLAVLRIKYR